MDKTYWENQGIRIYWWNFGKKTLDYEGTYKGFMDKKDIKVTDITIGKGKYKSKGLHFEIPLSSCKATYETCDGDYRAYDDAIKIFLTLMGDKSKFEASQRVYYINWK
jgi:hypothetical protein